MRTITLQQRGDFFLPSLPRSSRLASTQQASQAWQYLGSVFWDHLLAVGGILWLTCILFLLKTSPSTQINQDFNLLNVLQKKLDCCMSLMIHICMIHTCLTLREHQSLNQALKDRPLYTQTS
jgi:hypothetical protein